MLNKQIVVKRLGVAVIIYVPLKSLMEGELTVAQGRLFQ